MNYATLELVLIGIWMVIMLFMGVCLLRASRTPRKSGSSSGLTKHSQPAEKISVQYWHQEHGEIFTKSLTQSQYKALSELPAEMALGVNEYLKTV